MSDPAVSVNDLSVRYGEHDAVDRLRFAVPEGAMVSIVGPNGAGKSTTLKVLLGLVSPSHGEALLFGREPNRVPPDWIGYVPQVKTLDRSFPALSIELVLSGRKRRWPGPIGPADRRLAEEALARVGADHLAGRKIGSLSGGEMQRIYLARSLVGDPRLIFLDEPVTGVDTVGERDFYHLLDVCREEKNATIFIITHDWQVASYHSTHVLLLNRRQIGFGPPSDVLKEEKLRQAYGHLGHRHDALRTGGEGCDD